MWLNQLKIAIVEKNVDAINYLMVNLPQLDNLADAEQALYLTNEAEKLVLNLKDETAKSMTQMKKNIDFLKSTQAPRSSKLDITS